MIDNDMLNLAVFVADGLRQYMKPYWRLYKSGKMQGSVTVVTIEKDYVDIVIATDYASYTNTKGRWAGWVEQVVDRCCRAFAEENDVESEYLNGIITYE